MERKIIRTLYAHKGDLIDKIDVDDQNQWYLSEEFYISGNQPNFRILSSFATEREAKIWKVIFECNERVSAKPLFPDNRDKSIRFAIEFFQSDESPEKAVLSGLKHEYEDVSGYLWATNKRMLFVGSQSVLFKKPLYREFTYSSISTILYEKKFLSGKILLHVSTTAAKGSIASVEFESSGEQAQTFVNYVRNKIDNLGNSKSTQQIQVDFITELERLATLKLGGLISEDEYAAAKRKLLKS